jgi:carbon catabolite-derepressing protein kinase
MAAALDDDELSLSISSTNVRRHVPTAPRPPQSENGRRRREATEEAQRESHRQRERADLSRPGARLGQYKVVKTLGEGSFGKVKLAIHEVTGEKVALKIINRRKLVTRDMAGRIEREIQYLQLLRHPHIIKL